MEKKVAIIGVGNCGSQVANLAEKRYGNLIDSIYINTSASDLAMVSSDESFKIKIDFEDEVVEGSGKNRSRMKGYLKDFLGPMLKSPLFDKIIEPKKYVFIVASSAGGTGSGTAPALFEILRSVYLDVQFILVGVLPQIMASKMEQGNTVEFLNELYEEIGNDATYMIYDNETATGKSPTEALEYVNECIVEDIRVVTGVDNYATPYESIDEADMESILSTPGRLLITRVKKGLTEKNMEDNAIDDLIIKSIKHSCHTETDRNKKVTRWGVITYFTDAVNRLYQADLEKLRDFIGTPIERFNHNARHDGSESLNFLYLIAAGMSPINDRVRKVTDRIDELNKALAKDDANQYALQGEGASYEASQARRTEEKRRRSMEGIKLSAILDRFMK